MLIKKSLTIITVVFVSMITILECRNGFSESESYKPEQEIDQKTIREKKENGLNSIRQALITIDPYKIATEDVKVTTNELESLKERKEELTRLIQRTIVKRNQRQVEFANDPETRNIVLKGYDKKIKSLKQELADIKKQLPIVTDKLEEAKIEKQLSELDREVIEEDDFDDYDAELEDEKMKRFKAGRSLLNKSLLNLSSF